MHNIADEGSHYAAQKLVSGLSRMLLSIQTPIRLVSTANLRPQLGEHDAADGARSKACSKVVENAWPLTSSQLILSRRYCF